MNLTLEMPTLFYESCRESSMISSEVDSALEITKLIELKLYCSVNPVQVVLCAVRYIQRHGLSFCSVSKIIKPCIYKIYMS